MIKNCIAKLLLRLVKNRLAKYSLLEGGKHGFALKSMVSLSDGSLKSDVILEDKVNMYGWIISQSGGKVKMKRGSKLGYGCIVRCVDSVIIEEYATIGDRVVISDNNNHPVSPQFRLFKQKNENLFGTSLWKHSDHKSVIIGKNTWIGEDSRIQKGVIIGENSIVAAGSVVVKSVPANCIVGGNPAKIIKNDIDQIPLPITCEAFNIWISERK